MIIQNAVKQSVRSAKNMMATNMAPGDFVAGLEEWETNSGSPYVTGETCRNIATAYRCINVLSDDIAKLPLQTFISMAPGKVSRLKPSNRFFENIAWLLEISPNRWMTPFVFKKMGAMYLLTHGAARVWQPPQMYGRRNELFWLPTQYTTIEIENGQLWYVVKMPGRDHKRFPDSEVLSLLLNSTDGITGKGVVSYARETLSRQMASYTTQNQIARKGLNPSGILWMNGLISDKDARKKVRQKYEEAMSEAGVAILDKDMEKFEAITMKPVDAQFLESLVNNDSQIANFFGVPLYKLNQGKQSYESNEQQNLDYLNTTLDPYLVQWEQAAALKWLTEEEQNYMYFRFNRDALLRTDAKSRAEMINKRTLSGNLTINEGRQIEDMEAVEGGDRLYMPSNTAVVQKDGTLLAASGVKSIQVSEAI